MADVEDDEKFLYGGKVFLACYGLFQLYVGFALRFYISLVKQLDVIADRSG